LPRGGKSAIHSHRSANSARLKVCEEAGVDMLFTVGVKPRAYLGAVAAAVKLPRSSAVRAPSSTISIIFPQADYAK